MLMGKALLKLIIGVFLPLVTIVFVVSEHVGLWDRYLGLNHVIEAAGRLETSYAEGVDRILRPGEPAWAPLIKLIHRYSSAQLPADRQPKLLARFVAVASAKIDAGPGKIAEWTAPSTPITL